jgi:predicted nucleic acid-binding protein
VEPGGEDAARRLHDASLIAPPLLELEFTNVCLMKQRFGKATPAQVQTAFSLRRHFMIEILPVDHVSVFNLALATGLTAYNASYLLLARQQNAELVTLDT